MEGPVSNLTNQQMIQSYYSGWEKGDWGAIDKVLAVGFTFSSPNDDDHIDKRAFKAKCWSQTDYIERFELQSVIEKENEAFVKYLCHTKNGNSFRNTEYFRFSGGKVEAIEVYFGGHQSYPSAVSLEQK